MGNLIFQEGRFLDCSCVLGKKKIPLFKQVMLVIACALHNLIYETTTVTYVPWSEFSILGTSASFS